MTYLEARQILEWAYRAPREVTVPPEVFDAYASGLQTLERLAPGTHEVSAKGLMFRDMIIRRSGDPR